MANPRSLKQYRLLDLCLWAVMLLVFESLIFIAATRWFPAQPYTVSLVPVLVAAVLIRWGAWAGIHAVLGGALLCFLSRASLPQFSIYMLGNLASLAVLPWLNRWRREKGVFTESVPALLFGVAVLLLMQTGRALMTLVFGFSLPQAFGCFTTEVITDLFTLVILWIARRLDGILEDQPRYLRRIQEEETR